MSFRNLAAAIAIAASFTTLVVSADSLELKEIKSCKASLPIPDTDQVMKFSLKFSQFGSNFRAEMKSISSELGENTTIFPAIVKSEDVREGLSGEILNESETLNEAEKFISHAMMIESSPIFNGAYKTGIELAAVRSATVFLVDEPGVNIGATAVIEARDSSGKILGSFFGGFLIGACE